MAKIYVASSWRNKYQPEVVAALRKAGHEVYDFRNPKDNPGGFHWADVEKNWQDWQPELMYKLLTEWWATLMNWLTPCVKSRIAVLSRSRE